jgi:hypothetical protein
VIAQDPDNLPSLEKLQRERALLEQMDIAIEILDRAFTVASNA